MNDLHLDSAIAMFTGCLCNVRASEYGERGIRSVLDSDCDLVISAKQKTAPVLLSGASSLFPPSFAT